MKTTNIDAENNNFDGLDVAYEYGEELINLVCNRIKKDQENYPNASKKEIITWNKVIELYREMLLSKDVGHILKVPTGVGKTANFIQMVLYINEYMKNLKMGGLDAIILLSPDYENGIKELKEQINKFDKFNTKFITLEGKFRTCKFHTDPTIKQAVEKVGLPISYICNKDDGACKEDCIFYQTHAKLNSPTGTKLLITTHHQLVRYLPIFLRKCNKVLLIIDEEFKDGIAIKFKIKQKRIEEHLEFLKRVLRKKEEFIEKMVEVKEYTRKEYTRTLKNGKTITIPATTIKNHSYPKKVSKEHYLYKGQISYLIDLFSLLEKFLKENKIDYEELSKTLENLRNLGDTLNLLKSEGWYEFNNGDKVKPFKKFLFYKLNDYINNYFYQKNNKPENFENWVKNSIIRLEDRETKENFLHFKFFEQHKMNELLRQDKIIKLINTDATANKNDMIAFFENKFKFQEHTAENLYTNNIHIYQLKQESPNGRYPYALYSKKTFGSIRSFRNVEKNIKATLSALPDIDEILFLSHRIKLRHFNQSLWDYIERNVSNKFRFAYYPIKSTNKYEKVKAVLAVGTPLVYVDNNYKNKNYRESLLLGRDPEERAEETTRNLMVQGIGRTFRGTNDVYVFILSGFDLNLDLDVNYIYKTVELSNGKERTVSANENWIREMRNLKEERKKTKIVDKLTDFLQKNKYITKEKYAEIYAITPRGALNKLKQLEKKGILEEVSIAQAKGRPKSCFQIKN